MELIEGDSEVERTLLQRLQESLLSWMNLGEHFVSMRVHNLQERSSMFEP